MADFGAVFSAEQPVALEPSLALSVDFISAAPNPSVSATWYYSMRAWNTNLSSFVHWRVPDSPDFLGTYSGYPTGDIQDAIVQKSEIY